MPNDERVYDPVGFFLLRTPALPVETIASITGADTADTAVDDADRRSRTRGAAAGAGPQAGRPPGAGRGQR